MLGYALLATHDGLIWWSAIDDEELASLVNRNRFVDHLRPYRHRSPDIPDIPDIPHPAELIVAARAAAKVP